MNGVVVQGHKYLTDIKLLNDSVHISLYLIYIYESWTTDVYSILFVNN